MNPTNDSQNVSHASLIGTSMFYVSINVVRCFCFLKRDETVEIITAL